MNLRRAYNAVPLVRLCVVFSFVAATVAENVLISCTVGEGSHYFVGKTIGHYLVKRGHNVTMLLSNAYAHRAENPDDKDLNFVIFNHSVPVEEVLERHGAFSKMALEPFDFRFVYKVITSQTQGNVNDCEDLLVRNPDVMRRLEHGNFSVVIFDHIWPCSLFLAMTLKTQAVMSSPMAVVTALSTAIGNPVNLAISPELLTGLNPPMTFFERVTNVLTNRAFLMLTYVINSPFNELRHRLDIRPDIPGTINHLVASYPSLYLTNIDFSMEIPTAFFPNVITIGGITARPAAALPQELEDFMESSGDDGVILFTLGTYFHQVRPDWLAPFAEVFGKLKQKVLWQMKSTPPFKLPSNVKTLPWLPQNDILGHPKTRLFVFHGGNNGFYEAQYHAVPVVAIPLSGDGTDMAARAALRQLAVVIDKTMVTADRLYAAIKTVLNNDSYARIAQRQSGILRSRPMHPGDRAAFWVSHVMEHGGDHMRNPSLELNFIQRNLLDVIAILLVVVVLLVIVLLACCRCVFRFCNRVCRGDKEKRD
ncbi:UDP-glucuronosyltransferase 2A2-like [Diadema setosum]|uniref:UDP-glucuronosyltransferase 2A2-like n=1 Tax=Diadema setosum TaxID=31175 RepID=UPI003B3ACE9C